MSEEFSAEEKNEEVLQTSSSEEQEDEGDVSTEEGSEKQELEADSTEGQKRSAWDESWDNDDEDGRGGDHWKPSSDHSKEGEDSKKEIKVALDWIELEGALENNSPELHSFLNTVTGDVIRIFEGGENAEVRLKQSEASPDYIYVEPVSSREQYHWMEEFIEIVEEPTLKDKLNIAIDGKGAFRRFKDVLVGYPSEREKWFTKRSAKLREHMTEWLNSKHIVATNTPPWERDGEVEERRPRGE